MSEVSEKVLPWRVPTWFPELPREVLEQLKRFYDEVLRANKALDLISIKTQPHLDVIHFSDSIFASRLIKTDLNNMEPLYDLGSGGGFPGIVFSMLFPETPVVLVESNAKKCEFLKNIQGELGLKNLAVENLPIENLPENKIRNCMARGLGSITNGLLMARRIVKSGGSLYHFKGEAWALEVADIPTQLCSFWSPSLVGEYKLPLGDIKLSIIKTEKKK